jgi:hypothetical protein
MVTGRMVVILMLADALGGRRQAALDVLFWLLLFYQWSNQVTARMSTKVSQLKEGREGVTELSE